METQHEPRWERKANERPTALFEAALKAFATNGYRATRLEDVAEAAGVSKGTIYNYFKNKDDLLLQALEHKMAERYVELESVLLGMVGTQEHKIRMVVENMWKRWQCKDWGLLHRILMGEVSTEFPAFFETWAKRGPIRSWNFLAQVIEDGVRSGEFRKDVDSAAAARFLLSGLMQQSLVRIHLGVEKYDHCSRERIMDGILDIFLAGIRKPNSRSHST